MVGAGAPDFFYKEAQRLGYVARSGFKLLQIQNKHKLITPGSSVLDLGCAPGAWLQVACQRIGPLKSGGAIVGIDLKQKGFSIILSDMCPSVSGITTKDAALSMELGMRALELAVGRTAASVLPDDQEAELLVDESSASDTNGRGVLLSGGNLVIKLLESEVIQEFSKICKPLFRKASWLRPKATRSTSREIYLICQGFQ